MSDRYYWKVNPEPTGRYRSFHKRSWPDAWWKVGERIAASIECPDDYVPRHAKSGNHAPLRVRVADYSQGSSFTWRTMRGEYATLADAKAALARLLELRPELEPKP